MAAKDRESWWVLRAQTGDREAFDSLLKNVQGPLYRYVLSLVREPSLAEDILQEVFLRIYRKLRWLREPSAFRSWAYRIASREAFRHLRRERAHASHQEDEDALKGIAAEPPALTEFAPELIAVLPQMIEKLSPASRAVIVLYYLEEMSLEETAAVLDIPLGTVKSRLSYGLERLRREFQR
ncbi:MAG TPA: sigma-70 family RNA polymerase sigma factor [Pyrinomonadaceae bacterium]|nr:sigma-70 family RNA polymerase sigma factor [Pyrinomonadaceae bacterium]